MLAGGFGGLSRPAFPDIEGLEDFEGRLFHSAQWQHDVDLDGRRVGVIGTGASAIQLVPRVAKVAAHVDVFQRTPGWIVPKLDLAIGPRAKALFRRVPATQRALRALISRSPRAWASRSRASRPCSRAERPAAQHLARQVADPELRAKLTPSSRIGCKRILVSNDYYPALTRDDVDLVTSPIAPRHPDRGRDGRRRRARAGRARVQHRLPHRGGLHGARHPRPRRAPPARRVGAGIEAHRGTMVAGFPNLALLSGPNTGPAAPRRCT